MAAVPASAENERTVEERVAGDTELDLSQEDLEEVLQDLEADGHVKTAEGRLAAHQVGQRTTDRTSEGGARDED